MPAETRHHASGPLELAVVLALTAGFLDAFVYLNVAPVFVANMSGNLVRLGIALGSVEWASIAMLGLAVLSFFSGVVAATSHLDTQLRTHDLAHPRRLLEAEAVLLVLLAAAALVGDVRFSPTLHGVNVFVVVLAAAAMGMQAVALRRVGEIAVSTTYSTGAVVRLGEKLALAARGAERIHAVRRRESVTVLAAVLVAYVAGAVGAAAVPDWTAWLLLPPAVTALVGVVLPAQP